jgi:hypothetical protein
LDRDGRRNYFACAIAGRHHGIDDAEKLETYKGTTTEFIDPASGNYVYEPALKFFAVFERETAFIVDNRYDALDLRWQVISY